MSELTDKLLDIKTNIESAVRHIYWANACLRDENQRGYILHLQDALDILGYPHPNDVGLSDSVEIK